MQASRVRRQHVWKVVLGVVILLLAACGGGAPPGGGTTPADSSAADGQPVVPTMPPAKFTAVAQQSVAATAVITVTRAMTQSAQPSAQVLERGAVIYINRKCGDCHGAQAEGVADKGSALARTPLTFQEFEHRLRTGSNGALGPSHLYGPSAISPTGMQALYAWLQSLESQ